MREGVKKTKILYLMKILLENTDEMHTLTMEEIIEQLREYGIDAERKSLYDDINALKDYGVDIVMDKTGRNSYYHVVSRQFELAELKLLVDSVQSARFVSKKKSNELIKKLEGLTSKNEARELQHQVFVTQRIKSQNEKTMYNIDEIHKAIELNRRIRFRYFKLNTRKRPEYRHDGKLYEMSPWALTLAEENYYLVAFDEESGIIKYFRVDKMDRIDILEDRPRAGKKEFRSFDVADYARKRFRMYDGPETSVRLRCKNDFADVIFDRFGTDVILHDTGDDFFEVNVIVAMSRHFLTWVMAMNDHVVIAGPDDVLKKAKEYVKELAATYKE
ncbi:MAG: WYL domain-containing protein [Lachnospiraceae bacterium]|nr:WYL domain-containing protein [Lachnospiraceae bacterium]